MFAERLMRQGNENSTLSDEERFERWISGCEKLVEEGKFRRAKRLLLRFPKLGLEYGKVGPVFSTEMIARDSACWARVYLHERDIVSAISSFDSAIYFELKSFQLANS